MARELGRAMQASPGHRLGSASWLPTLADVDAAADAIATHCIETPLLEAPSVNREIGGRLLLKAENLQVTGSFKVRGALSRKLRLTPDELARGIVARSSGNHGLAVAHCARLLQTTATVVVPDTAPSAKVDRIKTLGARVIATAPDRTAAVAASVAADEQRIHVPPADDPWVVCGAGTVALEIVRQAERLGLRPDALLTCCSGGGLTAGCLLVFEDLLPGVPVYAVEPLGLEKMQRSLAAGRRIDNAPGGRTICDALGGPYTAAIPFEILAKGGLAGSLSVSDDEVRHAMRVAFQEYGLAVEPGGAAALAAVLGRRFDARGRVVAITVSGRNVDLDLASRILA